MFENYETYSWDKPLLDKLGLKPYCFKTHTKGHIGKVTRHGLPPKSYIDIYVDGLPAQFFEFKIYSSESNKKYTMQTGSGSLSDYYPIAEKLAKSMIKITEEPN